MWQVPSAYGATGVGVATGAGVVDVGAGAEVVVVMLASELSMPPGGISGSSLVLVQSFARYPCCHWMVDDLSARARARQ